MAAELEGWMEIGERAVWDGNEKLPLSLMPDLLAVQRLYVQLGWCTWELSNNAGTDAAVALWWCITSNCSSASPSGESR